MEDFIYLDNNSTTQIDPKVLEEMLPFLKDQFANASSNHFFGVRIKKRIEEARFRLSNLINANPKQVVFTSGATEAINLVLQSLPAHSEKKKHIITLETEHKAVLDTCKYLESIGYEVTNLPVQKSGLLQLKTLENAIRPDTLLVCVMWVNNETGVIQDIKSICKICNESRILFMTDATQAIGKIPVDISEIPVDYLTLSGHKFYAPKGIGALYFSKSAKHYLSPQIHGGGQENGFRSGTLNTAAIVGLGKAAEIAAGQMEVNTSKIRPLRDKLETELLKVDGAFINGDKSHRLFNVSNICFPNLEADILIGKLDKVAVSNGSACTSEIIEPSHVLLAMGLTDAQANSSIRFSLSKYNTEEEIIIAIDEVRTQISILQNV